MNDLYRRNNALNTNPDIGGKAVIAITTHGSDFYYAICAVMGSVAIIIMALSALKPQQDRIFFYITAAINATACIAYFSMGSNLGQVPIDVEFRRSSDEVAGPNREIFYARYIDWFVTTPLLLLDLLLTAGMPWPSIVWTVFLDWVMVVTGLIGALTRTRYKFGYYAFGCAAMFGIFWELAISGRTRAKHLGNDVHRVYLMCGVWTLFIWLLYPVAWGLCEGGNVISPDSEAVFYGVLDFCAKPLFSAMLIFGHWSISPSRMGLRIRPADEMPSVQSEKHFGEPNGVGATGDSATTTAREA